MSSKSIVVCAGDGVRQAAAAAWAERVGVPLSERAGEELTLRIDTDGLSLCGYGMCFHGDFSQMLRRVTGGRLQHEMLARLSKTDVPHPTAIDATAGMGEDSFLLAACGYEVTLYEQNPVIAALLEDALRRAAQDSALEPIVRRMHLINGDSVEQMPQTAEPPTLIYLDPMFPARQKSGLIQKKLQLIQKLESPCVQESALLDAALSAHPTKIIIKRPLKGAVLAGRKPHYCIKGKAIRYDCFHFPDAQVHG